MVKRDNNQVPLIQGVLNTDGATVTPIHANASTHIMDTSDGVGGSDFGEDNAGRGDNSIPTLVALSSAGDGAIVPLYVNSSNKLLIKAS